MISTIDKMSQNDKELLAGLYTSSYYVPLKKLLEVERSNTATKLLDVPPDDVVTIARHQGGAYMLKQLNLMLRDNSKKISKD